MALKLSKRISDTAWGDVDKTALGNKLAAAYAAGDVTKAQIRIVYLYVPDDAFGTDADGQPTFAYTKAKMPIAEVTGSEIVINRNGVHAAAGAHGVQGADLPSAAMTAAKRRLRGLYRKLKETAPDALKESIETIDRGKALDEAVEGSAEYRLDRIRDAFNSAFKMESPYGGDTYCPYLIYDTFVDAVIVKAWGKQNGEDGLEPDEFFKVGYTGDEASGYTFDPYEQWQVVELTYQPQTQPSPQAMAEGNTPKKNGRKRFDEVVQGQVELVESVEGDKPDGPWRIKAIGNTADVINGNNRRYPAKILRQAVADLQTHLNESAGQGYLRGKQPTGESDHPSTKGTRLPLLSETVINWDRVSFDGEHISVEGNLLGTAQGKDIRAQWLGGLRFGLSERGYGDSITRTEKDQTFEEVTELTITGFDLTLPGEQSDTDSGVTFVESRQDNQPAQENEEMDLEKLKAMLREHPELFEGLVSGKTLDERLEALNKMHADQLKTLDESIRKALGLSATDDIGAALTEAAAARKELAESKRRAAINTAIDEATKDLPYGKDLNALFVESIRSANPQDAAAVKSLVESKRREYDTIASQNKLFGMGFRGGVQSTAPVLESELGIPEYARGMHEITERMVRSGFAKRYDWNKPVTRNEEFAVQMLERFDAVYGRKLRAEAKLLEEAEQTTDLSLPYSVSRAIVAQVVPQLVAVSVFDVGTIDQSPFYVFYESYSGETGSTATVTDEAVTADLNVWVSLANQRLTPGTVVVTSSPAGTTYDENTDYVIDYANGRLMALATITDGQALLVDYGYTAIRKGEMATIERGKGTLSYKSLEAKADRLADQVSQEAIVFGRSQIGWDAVGRTMNMLINEIRRKIDQGIFYLALSAALSVANNSGGTWNSQGNPADYDDLVRKIGIAKVKVVNRYYDPNQMRIVMSTSMSDTAGNWEGFTAAGQRPDSDLKATGFVGRLKGQPVFESTEFPDSHVLSAHRELVAHRVYLPLHIEGPYKSRDASTGKLIAADEYYAEEFNATDAPVPNKGAYVVVS